MIRKFFIFLPLFTITIIGIWILFFYDNSLQRLFISADAQGEMLLKQGKEEEALKTFTNPLSIGAIYYKNGNFKKALEVYETLNSKEAFFNRGNALVMLGKYNDAIENYKLVLQIEPENIKAKENMALAKLRQEELDKSKNTNQGASNIGADKVVYDNKSKNGDDYEDSSSGSPSQEKWLDRLETSPSEFLRSKFLYQYHHIQKGDKR